MTATRPRLAVVTTHPIQYQAPWFRALAKADIDLRVNFVRHLTAQEQGVGFGVNFEWDVPLLDGYANALLDTGPGVGSGFFRNRLRGLASALKGVDVLLVTGWNEWTLVEAAFAARRARIPVIVRGETSGLKPRAPWVTALHRAVVNLYDAFLVIGEANRRFYENLSIPHGKLFAAPYFVDNERFTVQADALRASREALRKAWQIPESSFCFLFAGKLEPKKQILDLLAGAAAAKACGASLHVLVAGSGEQEAQAKEFARSNGVPVTFAGFLNQGEIARAYVAADALVLPSDFGETWGLVVNEAMACGLSAIVSDRVGCGPDLVRPETGFVFPFGDVAALAAMLTRCASRKSELQVLGQSARQRVLREYTVERSVDGLMKAVHQVLRG